MDDRSVQTTEEEVRTRVLVDNTAQGIFKYLEEMSNQREFYEKRWIWELLQNALDAAPEDKKVDVEITKNGKQLVFRHNGRPFKLEEVAHLIYHGSTKKEFEIGKFGTGFLVTHLLSKRVNVAGIRLDGKKFKFPLDRNGSSAEDIEELMKETWAKYQGSLEANNYDLDYAAEFEYALDEVSNISAEEGLLALRRIAPYILAFNEKLGNIVISLDSRIIKFQLVDVIDKSSHTVKVVKEENGGEKARFRDLWIVESDGVQTALELETLTSGKLMLEDLSDVPRLFIGFPLSGTEDLPYPIPVNSRKFRPTENRDGIFLGKDITDDNQRNKILLDEARRLFVKLISIPDLEKCENTHLLLRLSIPPAKTWLDIEWYSSLIRNLISDVTDLNILRTEDGEVIRFMDGLIPTLESVDNDKIERLWSLFRSYSAYREKLPAKAIAKDWAQIIENWEFLELDATNEKITLGTFAQEIEDCKNIDGLRGKLFEDADEFATLNEFYEMLNDTRKQHLFDSKNILPDQNNTFVRKPGLLRDGGIDEELKDISKLLGKDMRSTLLNSKIIKIVQESLSTKERTEVLDEITSLVRNTKVNDGEYLQANIRLLNWLVEHEEMNRLDGYPLQSTDEEKFVSLSKSAKEKPLAPKEMWNEIAKNYNDLFPEELVVASAYLNDASKRPNWEKLWKEGFVLNDPLFIETEKISQDDIDFLLIPGEKLDGEKDHEFSEEILVSKIAFIKTPEDKGIMYTVRKTRERTRKFLNFMFKYIVEVDSRWNNFIEVDCKCGAQHRIFPALWLVPLKDRYWVYVRKDKGERPSAHVLAAAIADDTQLLQICRQDNPSKLLSFLGVSISELMIHVVSKDEQTKVDMDRAMGSLYSTYMTNPDGISKIARLAESDPQLFIDEIEARLLEREQIRRNQAIGTLVENLLKSVLEKAGLKVTRTGVGSDFAIEHDLIEGNEEIVFEIKASDKVIFYIEIKATLGDSARMTIAQAKQARDNPDRHVLCVVKLQSLNPNEEDVKSCARFVTNIGEKLKDKVNEVENLQTQQQSIGGSGDIEIELTEGPVRFKVNKSVWDSEKTLEQFVELTKSIPVGIAQTQDSSSLNPPDIN